MSVIFIVMKQLIKTLLRENLNSKNISKKYLTQLLNHTSNNLALKLLRAWIKRGDGEMVKLSEREYVLLTLIKEGGPRQTDFSSKN